MTHSDIERGPAAHRHPDGNAVSVLGTGMLGTVIARALLQAGHRVTVWNRTVGKADDLVASGASRALTPADAVAASPIVITSVSTYDDVHAVVAREADRLAGRTLVNLSSGTPEQARTMSAWAAERGVRYLDGAAMSGTRLVGQPEALFLYSGDPDAYAAHEATLAALGRAVHLGADPGAASVYDTALLAMIMGVLGGFYQAAALVGAAGVDTHRPSLRSPSTTCRSSPDSCPAMPARSTSVAIRVTTARSGSTRRPWATSWTRADVTGSTSNSRQRSQPSSNVVSLPATATTDYLASPT